MNDDKLFPEYDIIAPLGEGAFANVYKVRHSEFGYIRAIRVLGETITSSRDPKYIKFLEECKILLRLGNGSHKNIVGITQPRLSNGKALVEMDYIEGVDLDEYIKNSCEGFVPIKECQRLFVDLASALAYCHYDIFRFSIYRDEDLCVTDDEEGNFSVSPECEKELVEKYKVIHNDIHSKNVRRKYDGSYVLLDFGLAIKNDTIIKSSTRKGGASEYKSPEKWPDNKEENDASPTEQGDIYSFGILMYEALAGNVPFPISSRKNDTQAEYELMNHHRHSVPEPIEPKRKTAFEKISKTPWQKDYPDWMDDVIMKCLEKKPENRYRNGKELFEAIQGYLAIQEKGRDAYVGSLNERIEKLESHNSALNEGLKKSEEQLSSLSKQVNESNVQYSKQELVINEKNSTIKELERTQKSYIKKIVHLEKVNEQVNGSKRSNYIRIPLIPGIMIAIAVGIVGYYLAGKQVKYREYVIKADPIYIYASENQMVRLYQTIPKSWEDSINTALDTLRPMTTDTTYAIPFDTPYTNLIIGFAGNTVVPILNDSLGFVYIASTNANGETLKGWVNKYEVIIKTNAEIIAELETRYVFADEFTDNKNDWDSTYDADVKMLVIDGKYMVNAINDSFVYYSLTSHGIDLNKEFSCSVQSEWKSGASNKPYGIIFCSDDSAGSCYVFYIAANGYYKVSKENNGKYGDVLAWATSSIINKQERVNNLLIKYRGGRVYFYINNQLLTSIEFSGGFGPYFGLEVYGKQKIEFDNFMVTGAKEVFHEKDKDFAERASGADRPD